MSKLYEISNDYQKAIDLIVSSYDVEISEDGEIKGYDLNKDLNVELHSIKESFENKAIAVAMYIRNLEADAEQISLAIIEMQKRSKNYLNQANSLREYLQWNMEKTGLTDTIKSSHFDIKIKTNPESLNIYDESIIPDTYFKEKMVKTLDKISIKKDIQSGFDVDGVTLIRKKVLVIK